MKNLVQLITYVDRLGGGGIPELIRLFRGPLKDVFGGVHLLPFFNRIDGADAGFDPMDHTQVDPRLGSWTDIAMLSECLEVTADLIVNHVSTESPQFQDFSERGASSPYAGMFLTLDRVFPGGVNESDLLNIYRPRPGLPFTSVTLKNGERHMLWTTFTTQQVDIDVGHPEGKAYLRAILRIFRDSGIRMIRLDAAGYAIKRPGTDCFMIPETYAFIAELSDYARSLGMEVLVEIHSYYREQIEIAKRVDRVYDFALPPLVLHALFKADPKPLMAWLEMSPRNAITVLDTHDGIGVIDVGADNVGGRPGLLGPPQIDELVESIHRNSREASRRATGAAASNLDLYQVNCTFYDALGRDDRAYLLARAIQFFSPGIPQVYYVGLLAGTNDMDLLTRTQVGRDINRHYFTEAEVKEALNKPVVLDLLDLIAFRNRHPAFGGEFSVRSESPSDVILEWNQASEFARLTVDLRTHRATITASESGREASFDLSPRCNHSGAA